MQKNVIAGLGETGYPLFQLISKYEPTIGYDLNTKLQSKTKFKNYSSLPTSFLHITIPFNKEFTKNIISLVKKFLPQIVVIHSTISPNTTRQLQSQL